MLLAVAVGATACSSLLGIQTVTDDPAFGDDGTFDSDSSLSGDARTTKDGGDAAAAAACDANIANDPLHCGSCGHACGTTNATVSCVGGVCIFMCYPGYAHCGADDSTGCSIAPGADPLHCGACDHSCLGTDCTSSLCGSTAVAVGQNASVMVAVDDQSVFWTNQGSTTALPSMGDGAVMRADKDGGAPTPVASNQQAARGITVDSTQVYWTSLAPMANVSATLKAGGGPVTPIATLQDYPWEVAVDAQNYYWVDGANDVAMQPAGTVWKLPRTGGAPIPVAQAQYDPISLAVGNGFLYWAQNAAPPNGALMRAPLDGGAAAPLGSANGAVSVALGDAGLFWANSQPIDGGSIESVPINGGAPVPILSNLGNPGWVVVDSAHIYWTDPAHGTIWRAGLDGNSPLLLAAGQALPIGIAVDDKFVYWAAIGSLNVTTMWYDNHDGRIMKVAK